MDERSAREVLVEAGRRLLQGGLVARSWGNLSLRTSSEHIAITPSGIPWNHLEPSMIVFVDLESGDWTGDYKPSGERKVHLEIYRRRPEVRAVVHTHQNAASVWAAARIPVPFEQEVVACAPYALPGTKKLTQATVAALGAGNAVLMANHGVFTVGETLEQAFSRAQELEERCASLIDARSRTKLPARADTAWNPAWLTEVTLPGQLRAWQSLAPFTLQWSKSGRHLPGVLDDLAQLAGRRVRTIPQPPKTRPTNDVVLWHNQGALLFGAEAETLAMVVEKAARAMLGAEGLGGAKPFPAWEAELMRGVYRHGYSRQGIR